MLSPTATFLLVSFLDNLSISMILPHLDMRAKELGFNHIQIGLVGAVFSGCQLITSPTIGSVSDVRGRKPMLVFCMIICSFTYFWLGMISSIFMFLTLRAVSETFKHTQFLIRAIAPDYIEDPTNVSILYGRLMSVTTLGMALGPAFSGNVMDKYPKIGFSIVCATLAVIFGVNTVLISKLPETANEKKYEVKEDLETSKLLLSIEDTLKQSLNKLYAVEWSRYWDIFLLKLLVTLAMGLYYSNFNLFLNTEHNVSSVNLGYIMSMQQLIGSITNNSIALVNKKYIKDTDYSLRMLHIFLVIALSLLGLSVVPSMYMYVALLIPKAVSFALARIVTLEVLASRSEPSNRGTLLGISNSIKSAAGILTPIVSGIINEYFGVAHVFYTGVIFASIGVVISYRVRSRSVKEKTH